MIVKSRQEAERFGIVPVNVTYILQELQDWIKSCRDDGGEDAVRFAMINSFEDIVLNSLVEE